MKLEMIAILSALLISMTGYLDIGNEPAHNGASQAVMPAPAATQPRPAPVTAAVQGSVHVVDAGSDTRISYTFTNRSRDTITVYSGAKYVLSKENKLVEAGGVPIKDYIELLPGEAYTDSKTFTSLPPGSYSIKMEWDKTVVTADFNRN